MSSLRGTKQTKAIQSNPALRGKNTSKLNQYKYQNQTAIDTINKYNELMNSGGWMSADDLTKYNSAIETYKTTGTALRDASKFYGTKYTEEEEKGWLDSLASLSNSYTSANELYSSFADADQFTNWWNYNTGKNEYHSVTGAEDYLQNSQYVKGGQDSRYDFINQGKGYSVPIAGMGADDLVAGFTSWLPDPARDAIGSALGYSEPLPDVDYSEFISDFFTGLVKGNPDAAMYTNNGDLELTDEEIGVYNYYYATQGKEKAEEYLKFIEEEIRQRKAGIDYANFKAADTLMDALLKTDTGNLGEYVYGYGAGVESGLAGLANMNALVKGTEGYTPASQYVSSMIRNDLGGKNGELTLEQVFYDLANTTGNMTPSLVVGGAAGPLAGAITMGLSSAGNNYTSFLKENYGVDAARAYGIITGVSEAGMSYLFSGIGKLGGKLTSKLAGNIASGLNNAAARIAVDFAKSFIGEAFEEAAQTALEPVFKWAATLGEAELEAVNWEEVGYSALLGGLSGGMLEGVPSLVQTGLQSHAAYTEAGGTTIGSGVEAALNAVFNREVSEDITKNAQNVTDKAVEYANQLESIDPGNKAAQYVLKQAENGKNISGYQINRLANEINETNTEAVKSAVKSRLTELGEGVMAGKVADVITKVQLGQPITAAEEAILNRSKNAYLVLTESDVSNIKGGGLANKWSESILKNLDSKNNGQKVKTPIAVRHEDEETETVNAENSGKSADSGITAVEIDGDSAVFTLANGEKVSADKMEYASDNHREVANIAMERTTRVPGFTAEVASAMIKGYDGASSVSDYSAAINDAYRYGYQGIPMAEISTGKNTSLIKNKTALYTAYDAGKQYAKSATTRPAFVGTKGKDAKGGVTIDKKIDQSKLTKEQRQQIKALDIIANALGINITVFESSVNAQGQHIGINGKYNTETHSIEIDLHAGADGRGVMLFTASHELTHHIRNVAADKFKVFADAVFEEIGKTGRSVDALIEKRVEEMRGKKDYKGLSEEKLYDKAYEEVVADAAESMLTDSDALARLSEKIKGKDKNLWDTIKSFFNDLVKKIKALYRQFNPDSLEGSLVRDMGDAAERLQNLWVEGLMEASEAGTEISAEEETMVSLDTKSESVSPEMFSERTWTASEYVTAREEMANKIANALGVSVRKAKKYIDDVNSIAKLIANDRARLDYEASSFGSAFVSNEMLDEYEGGHAQYPVAHGVVDKFVSEYEGNVKYQERISVDDAFSNRALLANALSSTVKSDAEADLLESYKKKIGELNSMNEELSAVQTQIDTLMKTVKIGNEKMSYATFQKQARQQAKKIGLSTENLEFGKRDNNYVATINGDVILKAERVIRTKAQNERLHELQNIAKELEQEITKKDKKLLELEATKALKDVVERERQQAYKAAAEKGREALRRNVEGRHKTAERNAIRNIAKDLDKLLNRGTKERNVKEGEQDLVRRLLEITDLLFATDDELLLNGIGTRYTDAEGRAMDDYMELYNEYHSYDNAVTENKGIRAKIRSQMNDLKSQFEGVLERERGRLSEMKAESAFDALIKEYEKLKSSEYSYIRDAYDNDTKEHLEFLKQSVGTTTIADMTLEQLQTLHKAATMLKTTIQNSNKVFNEGKKTVEELGAAAKAEIEKFGHKDKFTDLGKGISKISWNNLKPIYLLERTGSQVLQKLGQAIFDGESKWALNMSSARDFVSEVKEKHGYKKWDMNKTYKFSNEFEQSYKLTLGQMMSVYAYSKRGEQALEHLRTDGFVFDKLKVKERNKVGIPIEYELNDKTAYKITDQVLLEILNSLTEEQKAYVDEMQKYLSEDMAKLGNEISMQLSGINMFGEENYFPIHSSGSYLERVRQQQKGEVKMKNKGFTKPTQPHASNAIVLSTFNDVWSEHVSEMSSYNAFTLALEDFYKVYNYQTKSGENSVKQGVIPALENAFGEASVNAIDQLLKDLNGGARGDAVEAEFKKLLTQFKRAKTLLSLSVVAQQPSAALRAQSMIDAKYFAGKKIGEAKSKELWGEIKKYAPVAIIKEMGHFDVGMGRSSANWLMTDEYDGFVENVKGFFTDEDFRNEALGYLPAKADELAWASIWQAVKRETASKNPKLNTSSEEFFKIAGARFEDVIRRTQVYDSTLAKSANMRSKSALMQMEMAFMAEPTTSMNMLELAIRSGNKATIARTFGAVYASYLVNAILVALPYAMRDDDEDETFAEKYVSALMSSFLDNANPITSLPFVKDVWSLAQGYSIERTDMSLIEDAASAIRKLVVGAANGNADWNAVLNLAGSLSSFTGYPIANVIRDIKSVINAGKTITRDINGMDTTWNSMWDEIQETFHSETPGVSWLPKESKADKLYDAIVRGDAAYVERLRNSYADFSAYKSAVKKALRENDPRIKDAAEAYNRGDTKGYNSILDAIAKEGHFASDLIEGAIEAEANALYNDFKQSDPRVAEAAMATMLGKDGQRASIEKAIVSEGNFSYDIVQKARKSEITNVTNLLKEAKQYVKAGRSDDAQAIFNDLIKRGYTQAFIDAYLKKIS